MRCEHRFEGLFAWPDACAAASGRYGRCLALLYVGPGRPGGRRSWCARLPYGSATTLEEALRAAGMMGNELLLSRGVGALLSLRRAKAREGKEIAG